MLLALERSSEILFRRTGDSRPICCIQRQAAFRRLGATGQDLALSAGLVDALETGYSDTLEHAVRWCEKLLSLPQQSMLGNRAVARAHFDHAFSAYTSEGVASFVDTWFSDETQNVLKSMVDQLKDKK